MEYEIGGSCSTQGAMRNSYIILTRKMQGKTEGVDTLEDLNIDGS